MGGSHVGSDIETCMGGSGIRWCPVLAATHARESGRVTRLSKVVRTPAPAGVLTVKGDNPIAGHRRVLLLDELGKVLPDCSMRCGQPVESRVN